jgi:Fur family ferric uptake transcriptional regulator
VLNCNHRPAVCTGKTDILQEDFELNWRQLVRERSLWLNETMAGSTKIESTSADAAEQSIRDTGARLTRPRVMVLTVLLKAERALTHHEVEARLSTDSGVNRVTIYRVLEWLTENGLAHKISGEDRIWRFNAAAHEHAGPHAHFECSDCGQVLCLEPVEARPAVKLPAGFRQKAVELTVKGVCADCGPTQNKARTSGRHQH